MSPQQRNHQQRFSPGVARRLQPTSRLTVIDLGLNGWRESLDESAKGLALAPSRGCRVACNTDNYRVRLGIGGSPASAQYASRSDAQARRSCHSWPELSSTLC